MAYLYCMSCACNLLHMQSFVPHMTPADAAANSDAIADTTAAAAALQRLMMIQVDARVRQAEQQVVPLVGGSQLEQKVKVGGGSGH